MAAEDEVHHLQRHVIGRVARRTRQADVEHRLLRPRLVDEIDRGSARVGDRRVVERRLRSSLLPRRQRFLDRRLRGGRVDVADHRDDGAAGLEVLVVQRDDVVPRHRLDRRLVGQLSERVRGAVEDAREHAAADEAGLRVLVRERDEPLRAQAIERRRGERGVQQHVGEDVERRRELLRGRQERDRSALVTDGGGDVRAEPLEVERERVGVARIRPLAHHRRGERGHAQLARLLELVRAADERDRERDQRQPAAFGNDQLRAVGELAGRPDRHLQLGDLARRRRLRAIELLREGGQPFRRERRQCERDQQRRDDREVASHQSPPFVEPEETCPEPVEGPIFVLASGFAASSVFPSGTTLRTTRPLPRYLLATRLTSSGVTARRAS